ncbi:MAG: triose-phosphate isomerase [Clostridia bacterium]|nr:triose-phosphate isomerase [Clostridia bacterium]
MKFFIAGNWKMNMTKKEAEAFVCELKPLVADCNNKVVLCVPFTDIECVKNAAEGSNIAVGAQNVHFEEKGAYTGEVSADMLLEAGAEYVIIGHSERRQYFGETDETVAKRAAAALRKGLKPIICIGETLAEREKGNTHKVLTRQIKEGFKLISRADFMNVVVAYEPVWAIGTGKTATADEANNTIAYIREVLGEIFGDTSETYVLYGGSMNEKNAEQLLNMPFINGGLIGGASLIPQKFSIIAHVKRYA